MVPAPDKNVVERFRLAQDTQLDHESQKNLLGLDENSRLMSNCRGCRAV
jgi:hypothetical protein